MVSYRHFSRLIGAFSLIVLAGGPVRSQTALQAGSVRLHAANRGAPWIHLEDGKPLVSGYLGDSLAASALRSKRAKPLALASADFDEDGVPDVIAGYATAGGGAIAVHRGNIDALWPYGKAIRDGTPPPFLPDAGAFDTRESPDFLGAGDFDADGHQDIVAARRGGSFLWFFPGDGHGGFRAPVRVDLPGRITALTTGEINRRDGLADVVVGIVGQDGAAEALVFESPMGASRAEPEVFALPAPATGFVLSQLDRYGFSNLMVAAGHDLLVIHGRDRKLTLEPSQRGAVAPAEIWRQSFPFALRSIALHPYGIAALGGDKRVHVLTHTAKTAPGASEWRQASEIDVPGGDMLIAGHVSAAGRGDVIVLDRAAGKLHVLSPAPPKSGRTGVELAASLDLEAGAAAAVLPMRLNQHPLHSLVALDPDGLVVAHSTPLNTFVVTNTQDSGAGSLRQAINSANAATGPSSITFNIPTSDPNCNGPNNACVIKPTAVPPTTCLSDSPNVALPTIGENLSVSVTVDGYTQPGASPNTSATSDNAVVLIQIDGALDTFNSGMGLEFGENVVGFAVRGLSVTNWTQGCWFADGAGISIFGSSGGFVEGNFAGVDPSGTHAVANLDGIQDAGAPTFTSDKQEGGVVPGELIANGNTIGGTTPEARNIASGNLLTNGNGGGILVNCQASGETVQGNFVGTDRTGTNPLPSDIGIALCSSSATIGGTVAGAANVISGNNIAMEIVTQPGNQDLIQGNMVGTNPTGTGAINLFGASQVGLWVTCGANTSSPACPSSAATIGGTTPAARNIISGNSLVGIQVDGSSQDTLIQGNYIGLDITGSRAIPNGGDGVGVGTPLPVITPTAASNTTIGGAVPGAGNVISGNGGNGIEIHGLVNNFNETPAHFIQGNLIGTDATGSVALGNTGAGIALGAGTYNTTIGSTDTIPRNTIAFNGKDGVLIDPGVCSGCSQNNPVTGNTIFSNAGAGVRVNSGTQNRISRNSIYGNGKLGIDIDFGNPDFVSNCQATTNGPNDLQNAPALTAGSGTTFVTATATDPNGNTSDFSNCAPYTGSAFTFLGTFNGLPNTNFTIEFFKNDSCDASGFGQGKTFVGSTTVTSAANCTATIHNSVDLSQADMSITETKSGSAVVGNPAVGVFTAVATNNGATTAHNVVVTDALPAALSLVSATSTQGSCANSGNNITCSLGTMAPGATSTIVIDFNALTTAAATNTINVTATETDPNTANNSANATVSPTNGFPTIDHFDPPSVIAGSPDLSLNLIDTTFGFIPGVTTVTFNGTPLTVTGIRILQNNAISFSPSTCGAGDRAPTCQELTALVPAAMLTTPGTPVITVTNPGPGGGSYSTTDMTASSRFMILSSCTYTIVPGPVLSVGSGGEKLLLAVTPSSESCTWTNSSNAPWIYAETPTDFQGTNNFLAFDILTNSGAARTGTITVAGQTITVNQAGGAACSLNFSGQSENYPMSGGAGSISVLETPLNCGSWMAGSDSSWLTIASGGTSAPQNQNGVISYSVAANSGTARTGHITVTGGQSFTITQQGTGVSCTFTLVPLSANVTASAGANAIGITASDASCPWTATSNSAFLTIVSGGSGTGNGTVNYSYTSNTGGARSGTILAAGQTFTVNQAAGNAPSLAIAKSHSGNFTQNQQGATYTLMVTNAPGGAATSGTVTVTETPPSGLALVSMSGANWSCSGATCTRGDVLAVGASYDPITVTVNVGLNASSPQVNMASVSGGGSATASASDPTVINSLSGGAVQLFGDIASKGGAQAARVWTFAIGNSGTGTAANAQITGISFTQTSGAACTPVVTSPASFPLGLGNILPGSFATGAITINFTGCPNAAKFTVQAGIAANGASSAGVILRNNEEW